MRVRDACVGVCLCVVYAVTSRAIVDGGRRCACDGLTRDRTQRIVRTYWRASRSVAARAVESWGVRRWCARILLLCACSWYQIVVSVLEFDVHRRLGDTVRMRRMLGSARGADADASNDAVRARAVFATAAYRDARRAHGCHVARARIAHRRRQHPLVAHARTRTRTRTRAED